MLVGADRAQRRSNGPRRLLRPSQSLLIFGILAAATPKRKGHYRSYMISSP